MQRVCHIEASLLAGWFTVQLIGKDLILQSHFELNDETVKEQEEQEEEEEDIPVEEEVDTAGEHVQVSSERSEELINLAEDIPFQTQAPIMTALDTSVIHQQEFENILSDSEMDIDLASDDSEDMPLCTQHVGSFESAGMAGTESSESQKEAAVENSLVVEVKSSTPMATLRETQVRDVFHDLRSDHSTQDQYGTHSGREDEFQDLNLHSQLSIESQEIEDQPPSSLSVGDEPVFSQETVILPTIDQDQFDQDALQAADDLLELTQPEETDDGTMAGFAVHAKVMFPSDNNFPELDAVTETPLDLLAEVAQRESVEPLPITKTVRFDVVEKVSQTPENSQDSIDERSELEKVPESDLGQQQDMIVETSSTEPSIDQVNETPQTSQCLISPNSVPPSQSIQLESPSLISQAPLANSSHEDDDDKESASFEAGVTASQAEMFSSLPETTQRATLGPTPKRREQLSPDTLSLLKKIAELDDDDELDIVTSPITPRVTKTYSSRKTPIRRNTPKKAEPKPRIPNDFIILISKEDEELARKIQEASRLAAARERKRKIIEFSTDSSNESDEEEEWNKTEETKILEILTVETKTRRREKTPVVERKKHKLRKKDGGQLKLDFFLKKMNKTDQSDVIVISSDEEMQQDKDRPEETAFEVNEDLISPVFEFSAKEIPRPVEDEAVRQEDVPSVEMDDDKEPIEETQDEEEDTQGRVYVMSDPLVRDDSETDSVEEEQEDLPPSDNQNQDDLFEGVSEEDVAMDSDEEEEENIIDPDDVVPAIGPGRSLLEGVMGVIPAWELEEVDLSFWP